LPVTHHQQTVYPRLSKTSPFTIVLLNGWGMTAGTWGSLIPVLQKEHDVVVVDVVYSEDVDTLCDTIYSELPERCVLIGWSLGGMLATKITAMYPRSIVGLITLSSNAQFVADSDWPHAMPADTFEAFFQLWTTTPEKSLQRFSSLVIQGDKQRREQKKYLQSFNNTNARMEAPVEYPLSKPTFFW
jgi:pimeloyl-ACP methyl ester carboxylesterase